MFLNKMGNIFCVPDTKFVSATNVARAGKRGNISCAMKPWSQHLKTANRVTLQHCHLYVRELKKLLRQRQRQRQLKMNFFFTNESWNSLKPFTLFIIAKLISKLIWDTTIDLK